jgi:hypothetical protein
MKKRLCTGAIPADMNLRKMIEAGGGRAEALAPEFKMSDIAKGD